MSLRRSNAAGGGRWTRSALMSARPRPPGPIGTWPYEVTVNNRYEFDDWVAALPELVEDEDEDSDPEPEPPKPAARPVKNVKAKPANLTGR